jgi:CBS domain-containing protein
MKSNTLSAVRVSHAMRRQAVGLHQDAPLEAGISVMIKYKINALMVTDDEERPVGVVSKTDLVGAYYAELPIDSPLEVLTSRPLQTCRPEDSLESALDRMRTDGIYRLYVTDDASEAILGVLAYPDIVGLLYRYCYDCRYSRRSSAAADRVLRFCVRDVMTPHIVSIAGEDTLYAAMEMLTAHRFGAVLVQGGGGEPDGVISKTDLVLAYRHGIDPGAACRRIMSVPVQSCSDNDLLEDAIRRMVLADIQRLFVHRNSPQERVGVLSLSDLARVRSGSCRACSSSRIRMGDR